MERRAIETIRQDLGLPAGDAYTQDWVHELPDEYRTMEWLKAYSRSYANPGYGEAEKRLLMSLMLDVANDLLDVDSVVGQEAWDVVRPLLLTDNGIHRAQIDYWVLDGKPLDDGFALTPMMRELAGQLRRE